MTVAHVLVLGAGPAGAAVALSLGRLGYRVSVVSEWRHFDAVEGVSARVLEGLRQSGLSDAAQCVYPPSVRHVHWNGTALAPNAEYLVDRRRFDIALRQDLRRASIDVIRAHVRGVQSCSSSHRAQIEGEQGTAYLEADFLVEARGRLAPAAGKGVRGPETLSLLSQWKGRPGPRGSAVESMQDGWAWMARLRDGRCYWQWTLDAGSAALPRKNELAAFCAARRAGSVVAMEFFGASARRPATLHARSSTATLCAQTVGANWLRVGDAAMAVDPLSGNGMFQSLSSALQAPAVINTILTRPERAPLARRFHQQRIDNLFARFARIGRDFYATEHRWACSPFWQPRNRWPDEQPLVVPVDFRHLRVERAPVIRDGLIDEADVVITPEQPVGIWHLNGVELAPVIRALQREPNARVLETVAPRQRQALHAWLAAHRYPVV
ncbi:NAD(P)/FAD-dependent oxidoreductase [Cupriavidus basilensis]|uniref:FAD-dependent monooxygenase n=1 Tax=Cupriavidus basilensis TaxID=68895 RepID=A0A643FLX0_9BURK|nr:FAD-dependent monooxygenase [Cupriavidus basilensis]QOT82042.1 FAD-dependent monooxygenase [Cupriavidus basilensis]